MFQETMWLLLQRKLFGTFMASSLLFLKRTTIKAMVLSKIVIVFVCVIQGKLKAISKDNQWFHLYNSPVYMCVTVSIKFSS